MVKDSDVKRVVVMDDAAGEKDMVLPEGWDAIGDLMS